jgi:cell division septation protein DedD
VDIPGIRHRIIKHLPAYLLKYGSVDLAGLGRFRLDPRTSFIDYNLLLVYPPYYDVVFEENQYSGAYDYVSYLSRRLGLDDALIAEVMSAYTNSLRERLANDKVAAVDGLGRIIHTQEKRLVFESDKQFWGQDAVANLAISFKPVPRIKEMAEKQPVTPVEEILSQTVIPGEEDFLELKEELFEEEWDENMVDADILIESEDEEVLEETADQMITAPPLNVGATHVPAGHTRVDETLFVPAGGKVATPDQSKNHRFIVPLMVLLLLLAIPLFWYLTRGDGETTSDADEIEVPQSRLNQNPKEAIVDPQQKIESNQERLESAIPTQPEDVKSISQNEEEQAEIVEENKESVKTNPTNDADIPSKSNKPAESTAGITAGDCVIIVGAFGEGPNMRKMMNRLEAKGFKVYVDSTRSLSRVGVYSTCRSVELKENLSIIQSDIEPKSWILNR